jgi:glutamate racemase
MPIGFMDSGVGGLTVLKEALRVLPHEDYLYYADMDHAPYGTKPLKEVRGYVFGAVKFLVGEGIKALVVACNTATIVAVKDLRRMYNFPIVGMEPAVKPAVEHNRDNRKRVLVTATPLALQERKFQDLVSRVDDAHIVDLLPLPELVNFAQHFIFDEAMILPYLQQAFAPYDLNNYGTVVLGCTHFPFYNELFRKLLPPHIEIINGNAGTIRHFKNLLTEAGLLNPPQIPGGNVTFYTSGRPENNPETLHHYRELLQG